MILVRRIPLVVLIACGLFATLWLAYSVGVSLASADGSGSALVEAGSGSATAAPTPADSIADPISDPVEAYSDAKAAQKQGWAALACCLLVMASLVVGRLGRNMKTLAWLAKGKWAVIVGGVGAAAAAGYNAAIEGGSPYAVLFALGMAAAMWWNAQPSDQPIVAKETSA